MDSIEPPAFSTPLLHTLTTPDLGEILHASGFANLAQLVAPFSAAHARPPYSALNNVQLRTPPNHEPRSVKHFSVEWSEKPLPPGWDQPAALGTRRLSVSVATPSSPAPTSQSQRDELFLDQLSSTVAACTGRVPIPPEVHPSPTRPQKQQYDLDGNLVVSSSSEHDSHSSHLAAQAWDSHSLDELTPWYAQFRDQVFARRQVVPYETWGWPVGCVLALSTDHPDPLNAISLLWDLTSPSQLYLPEVGLSPSTSSTAGQHNYVNPEVLRYILIVHDARKQDKISWQEVARLEETVKKTYGVHTKVLTLYDNDSTDTPANTDHDDLVRILWPESDQDAQRSEGLVGLGYEPETASPAPRTIRRGHDLSRKDLGTLSEWTREIILQSVIPSIERSVIVAHEQFQSSKKSIGGRLFSVGRKYFGGGGSNSGTTASSAASSRTGSPVQPLGYNAQRGFYPYQSQESQSRRLADLAFMLRDYKLAQQVYAEVTKDFKNDKAWKHYAVALRMQGLCQILASFTGSNSTSTTSPDAFLQSSILSPAPTTAPPLDFDLLRQTMLYHHFYPLLLTPQPQTDISKLSSTGLMRLVDLAMVEQKGQEDELWTAMLCEQSALSRLGCISTIQGDSAGRGKTRRSRTRKFGLEMCLAGIKYEKYGLKTLSRRCLSQASTVYSPFPPSSDPSSSTESHNTTFDAVRSYLHHSLARQAYNSSQPLVAISHYLQLLATSSANPLASQQQDAGSAEAEASGDGLDWLDDFSLAWDLLGNGDQDKAEQLAQGIELPVRLFDAKRVKVVSKMRLEPSNDPVIRSSSGAATNLEDGWGPLEKMLLENGRSSQSTPGGLKGKLREDQALVGQTFYLELPISNPLEAFLSIGGLRVRSQRTVESGGEELQLEIDQPIDGEIVELAPLESRLIYIPIRGSQAGAYEFASLSYRFHNLLPVNESLSIPLRATPLSITPAPTASNPTPAAKVSLPTVELLRPIPILSVSTLSLPNQVFHGQTQICKLKLQNKGQVGMKGIQGVSSNPAIAFFCPPTTSVRDLYPSPKDSTNQEPINTENKLRNNRPVELLASGTTLEPGEAVEVELVFRGDEIAEHQLQWLFAYESTENSQEWFSARASHRLVVAPSLEFRYSARPDSRLDEPFKVDIEAYNSGVPASDLCITSVSVISALWKAAPLPGTSFETVYSSPIGWQQLSNLAFTLGKVDTAVVGATRSTNWTVGQVDNLLQGKKLDAVQPNDVDLVVSGISPIPAVHGAANSLSLTSILASYSEMRRQSLLAEFPIVPSHLLPSIFPLFASTTSLVVIRFLSESLKLEGHHILPLPTLGASHNHLVDILATAELKAGGLYAESQKERTALIKALRSSELGRDENPAFVSIEIEDVQTHDFDQGACSLPVTFAIRNLSPFSSFDYQLSLGTTAESALVYTGLLTRRGSVPPLTVVRIAARAFIARAGTYDLGGWMLAIGGIEGQRKWVQYGDRREVLVKAPTHTL
ncbi:TRAPP III-specific subunit 85 family protein [Sporobolomyces koalae]|uniref:TRAPP III-specific subunit 85 family protein n=1 Tax=Sporobolomyces koalae TaxID=500713 RepID=UPI003171CC9F